MENLCLYLLVIPANSCSPFQESHAFLALCHNQSTTPFKTCKLQLNKESKNIYLPLCSDPNFIFGDSCHMCDAYNTSYLFHLNQTYNLQYMIL